MTLDIFSNKKEKKLEITVDKREKNSLVIAKLNKIGVKVNIKHLKVGDYLIKNTVIERKTVNDFLTSMVNKRLARQLEEIQQYPQHLLIIEGQHLYQKPNIHPNAIRGFLLSTLLNYEVPIIFTKDEEDTANYLKTLAKQQEKEKEKGIRPSKKTRDRKEKIQYILEGFESIGPKTAKKLLKKYKTIKNIINAPINDLKNLIGKKAETFKIIEEEY